MIKMATALIFSVLLSGCASLLTNSAYPVAIDSWPGEAAYVIRNHNGVEVKRGMTPDIAILESGGGYFKRANYTVSFYREGYPGRAYRLAGYFNGWYVANLLNLIGFFIDPATGAMWRLPERVSALLLPDNHRTSQIQPPSTMRKGPER
ncbi:MAG: hypothetical protein ACU83P_09275 [Gammaproteobacteria bacterium]